MLWPLWDPFNASRWAQVLLIEHVEDNEGGASSPHLEFVRFMLETAFGTKGWQIAEIWLLEEFPPWPGEHAAPNWWSGWTDTESNFQDGIPPRQQKVTLAAVPLV